MPSLGCGKQSLSAPAPWAGTAAGERWVLTRLGGLPWAPLPPGVDDAESECGLDQGVTFDWVIANDGDERSLDEQLEPLLRSLRGRL